MNYIVTTESNKYCGFLETSIAFSRNLLRNSPNLKETTNRSSLVPVFITEYLYMLIDSEAPMIIELGDREMVEEAFARSLVDYGQIGLDAGTLLCIRTKELTAATVNSLLSGRDSIGDILAKPELFKVL